MKTTLTPRQNQQLKITPQLQQAIRLLQLSNQSLEVEIQTLLDKNPFLELEQAHSEDNSIDNFGDNSNNFDNFDNPIEYISHARNVSDNFQEYQDWLQNREMETTLKQHLLWQLTMGNFSESQRLVATLLIEDINDEGYLSSSLEDIQISFIQQYPEHEIASLGEIEVILQKIQRFDPVGVGTRSLLECLSVQLTSMPKDRPWIKEAIHALQYLDLISKRDYTRLKKKLNLEEEGLRSIIKILKALNPKPGKNWITTSKVDYIIPDLIVRKQNGRFVVKLNMNTVPKLRLNPEYINLMNRVGSDRSNSILKEHFNEARLFLNSLKHRQESLLNVAKQIVDYQQDFFEHGAAKLRPLILKTVAEACGFHESTVSRITTQKYVDSPRGMFELKYFFSNSACENQKSGSHSFSSKAIQAEVKKLIEQELPTHPLTDDTIMKMLAEGGIQLSRRTITKYREKMKILSSHERKSLKLFNNIESRRMYDDAHSNYWKTTGSNTYFEK